MAMLNGFISTRFRLLLFYPFVSRLMAFSCFYYAICDGENCLIKCGFRVNEWYKTFNNGLM